MDRWNGPGLSLNVILFICFHLALLMLFLMKNTSFKTWLIFQFVKDRKNTVWMTFNESFCIVLFFV